MNALTRREVPPWVDRGLRLVTHAGGATATMTISLLLLLNPSTRHLGLVATMANLLSHLLVQGLKRTVSRPRPSALLPQVTALTAIPDHYSLPSGHACAAMALATTILLAEPVIGIGALLAAALVGASRVYLRVHYPTDVVVGQALGAGAAVVVHLSFS